MFQGHPYLQLRLPQNASFELKPSPGKGWGVFATKYISRGDLILQEKALFIIRKHSQDITEEDLQRVFADLGVREKEQFLCLRDNGEEPFPTLLAALRQNDFALRSNPRNRPDFPAGHGIYLLLSRLNHSCVPNSVIPTVTGDILSNFATRDILPGEELTFSYKNSFAGRTRLERHEILGLVCECKACVLGTAFQELSDLRRRLIRGLQYLTTGVDVNGRKYTGGGMPIIIDAGLRREAEELRISISKRLICAVMMAYLLEEEGLLDNFTEERLLPGIEFAVICFESERNAEIARLLTVQGSWLEKLCGAFRLYGRSDPGDRSVAALLRG